MKDATNLSIVYVAFVPLSSSIKFVFIFISGKRPLKFNKEYFILCLCSFSCILFQSVLCMCSINIPFSKKIILGAVILVCMSRLHVCFHTALCSSWSFSCYIICSFIASITKACQSYPVIICISCRHVPVSFHEAFRVELYMHFLFLTHVLGLLLAHPINPIIAAKWVVPSVL